jgi:hypothetical protein
VRRKNGRHDNGAGSEIMPEKRELSKDGFTGQGLDVTHQLVRRAETKLVGLHANRSQLRRRIRALHYLLKTLETELSPVASPDPGFYATAQESRFNRDESSDFERDSNTAVTPTGSKETTSASAVIGVSNELRRACRIALMESDQPQCCEQILQRIRRRESACVEGFHDLVVAIAQELCKMLADGEVTQKDNHLWQLNRDSGPIARREFAGT